MTESPQALPNGQPGPGSQSITYNHNHNQNQNVSSTQKSQAASQSQNADSSQPPSLAFLSADLNARVSSFLSEEHDPSSLLYRVQEQTRISLQVIRDALSRYALRELSLSYNGGKDCLVLLVLFLASLHPHLSESSASTSNNNNKDGKKDDEDDASSITTIPAFYASPAHPFSSVESFVRNSSAHYRLELSRYTTNPPHTTLRDAFASYLSTHPQTKAIFVGTRRTDPHGAQLMHFDPTDRGWPAFMRIHPVVDWHYAEIWAFIRRLGVEYCPLYDEGYTSLGGTNDTHPNPKLRRLVKSGGGVVEVDEGANNDSNAYRPAYELMDDDEERLGRD